MKHCIRVASFILLFYLVGCQESVDELSVDKSVTPVTEPESSVENARQGCDGGLTSSCLASARQEIFGANFYAPNGVREGATQSMSFRFNVHRGLVNCPANSVHYWFGSNDFDLQLMDSQGNYLQTLATGLEFSYGYANGVSTYSTSPVSVSIPNLNLTPNSNKSYKFYLKASTCSAQMLNEDLVSVTIGENDPGWYNCNGSNSVCAVYESHPQNFWDLVERNIYSIEWDDTRFTSASVRFRLINSRTGEVYRDRYIINSGFYNRQTGFPRVTKDEQAYVEISSNGTTLTSPVFTIEND